MTAPVPPGDDDLLRLAASDGREGHEAYAALYDRYATRLYTYCRRAADDADEANDVFQGTVVAMYEAIRQGRPPRAVLPWLLRTARNRVLNLRRSQRKYVELDDLDIVVDQTATYERVELHRLLEQAIAQLPQPYRDVVVMREQLGCDYDDVAEVVGLPVSHVRVLVHRAKERLRRILAPYIDDMDINERVSS